MSSSCSSTPTLPKWCLIHWSKTDDVSIVETVFVKDKTLLNNAKKEGMIIHGSTKLKEPDTGWEAALGRVVDYAESHQEIRKKEVSYIENLIDSNSQTPRGRAERKRKNFTDYEDVDEACQLHSKAVSSKKPKNHLQDKSKKACMKINQSIIQKMSDKYCKTKGNGGVNERILEPKEWVPKRLFQNNSSTLGKTKRKHPTCRVEIEYESDVCTSSESDDEMFKIRKMDFDSVCVKLIESRRRARTLQKELKDVQIRNVVLQKDLPGMINSVTGFMNSVSRTGDTKCLSNMPVHDARGCLNVSTSVVPNQECLPSASVCPTISTTPKVSKSSGNAGHSDCNFDVLESSSVAGPSNEVAKKNNSTGSHSSNDDLQAEESEGVEISDSMKSDVSKNGYTSTKYTGSSKDNDQDQGMDEPNVSVNGNTSTEYSSKDNDHEQGMDEPNDMQVPAIDAGTEERDCESLEDCYSILNKQTVLAVQKCRKWGKATGFLLRALFSKEDIRQNSRVTDKHGGQPLNPQKIGLIVRHVLKQFKGTEIEKGRTIEEKDVKDRLKHALKYWRKSLFPNVIES